MSPDHAFTAPQRALLTAAALVIVVAGVHAASSVVGPFLLAVFVAVVATPALRWLQRFGWPTWAGWCCCSAQGRWTAFATACPVTRSGSRC